MKNKLTSILIRPSKKTKVFGEKVIHFLKNRPFAHPFLMGSTTPGTALAAIAAFILYYGITSLFQDSL